jgi:extracellular factor (EF) 3-hydroxypalmitic acid methyl ester biosynthesis protein
MGMAGNGLRYLTTNDWVLIRAKTELRTFKLGEEIIREGDWIQSLYIIRRGEASVELAATGARAIVATLGPKDLCGDMAFLGQSRATATVVAKDVEIEVEEINSQDLRAILEAFPRLASRFTFRRR